MDRNSPAPALESHIPQIVLAVHSSPVHVKSKRSHYSVPNVSPNQQEQLLAGAVDSLNQYSQIFTSEDQGTSGTQNFLVSYRHKSPQTAESDSSNPTKPLIKQGERAADTSEAYEKSLQYNATADQCTVRTQDMLTLPVHESRLCGKNNPSSPFVSAPTPVQEDTVEALVQTLQIYAFKDQHLLGTQDLLLSDVHKFPHPTESNPNTSLLLDVPPTQKGAQTLHIYVDEDQGTIGTKDRVLSHVHDSQLSVGSNQKNPAEADVSSTQQEESEDFAQSLQTKASDVHATSGTQTLLVSNYHEFLLPAETNSHNASVTDVSPVQQGGCDQDVLEAVVQALIYTYNDQDKSGTQDLLLLTPSEPGVSPTEQGVCATDINEAPAQGIQICMSEDQGTPGNEDVVVLAQHQFPPSSENNSNIYSGADLSPAQQAGCDRDSLEAQAQGVRSYASEEHCTPATQDSLDSVAQDASQAAKSVLNSSSFQEASPVHEKQYITDIFEAFEQAVQISKNQAVSGTQDVGTNDRATNAGGSSEGNSLAENAVVTSYGDATKFEENQRVQDSLTFQNMSGSRISNVRRYSVSGSSKSSSSGNYNDNVSHDMFSSRPSLSDTDETDRAESVAAMMSLVNRYSDYFEDIEENQSERYAITMISTYVQTASTMIGNVRLVAGRIFTSPNSAANLLYDINWTVLYLAVDEEVDLHDVSSCYKLRLLAIKAYIRTTCVNTTEGAITEAIRQEFLGNSSLAGEQNGCTSQVASRLQETDVGAEGAIPFSDGVYRDDVIPASDGTHIKGGRGCKQVYSECHRYQHKDTTRQRAAVLKICYIAEERVCRIRIINWVMLNCFKTVLSVLGLGLEAKRMAQRAVKEAMRRQFPGTNHVVAAIAKLAIAASNFAETALKHMEQAVRLHRIVVEALKQAERSLYNLKAEACCGRNDIRDIIACVNVVEEAVQRTCEIYLDKVDGNFPPDASGAVLPPFQSSKLRALTILHQRSDQDPRDVFEALLWATQSAVKTIDVTLRGLQNLSLSVLFHAVHVGKL